MLEESSRILGLNLSGQPSTFGGPSEGTSPGLSPFPLPEGEPPRPRLLAASPQDLLPVLPTWSQAHLRFSLESSGFAITAGSRG